MPRIDWPLSPNFAASPTSAPDHTDAEILQLHALGTELLVVMQNVCEYRGRRMQSRQTARTLCEHGIAWDVVTSATGIVESDLGEG